MKKKFINIRKTIPALNEQIYVNWGGAGPTPRLVVEKINTFLQWESTIGPFHPKVREKSIEIKQTLRETFAKIFKSSPDEIAITDNTTTGINIAASGIDWKKSDEVIIGNQEHPGGFLPWLVWAKRKHIRVKLLQTDVSDKQLVKNLKNTITKSTKVVCISHISWLTGRSFPIKSISKICRKNSALLVVDGAQSIGQKNINIAQTGADIYTISGQKWLMGPQGTGALYIRKHILKNILLSRAAYGTARLKNLKKLTFTPFSTAKKFECGTMNLGMISGLIESLKLYEHNDPSEIENRIKNLTEKLIMLIQSQERIRILSPIEKIESGIISFIIQGIPTSRIVELLLSKKIILREVESDPPSVRISIHYVNTEKEIEDIASAIIAISQKHK
ncbi:MAG: aminotransferase class V-fold PLP-dependent enzyme [Nitrospinota bacterium]|nr:aminotransferase class V-fold PLP-dependent enzyme [Nitrospinota bacterium]